MKFGWAHLELDGNILAYGVESAEAFEEFLCEFMAKTGLKTLILGNATASNHLAEKVRQLGYRVIFVEEAHSTLEGRRLYFEKNPPQGFWRLIPLGLQNPPVPYDGLVAAVIGRRYLKEAKTNG